MKILKEIAKDGSNSFQITLTFEKEILNITGFDYLLFKILYNLFS